MKERCCIGLIVLASLLLTGCGSHFSAGLATGRQMAIKPSDHDGVFIYLGDTAEVRLHLQGLRMGLTPHTKSPLTDDDLPGPKPWLSYHLHF